ncbi:hypothetical protein ACFFX0_04050 [Citricoccus parietis]|uniref:Uncharacterized protein n=1 Tax=Citricoccus parietis TaxID=592307 RepID=A0ABV5FUR0_9MICC
MPETSLTSTAPSSDSTSRCRRTAAAVRLSSSPTRAALTGPWVRTTCSTRSRVLSRCPSTGPAAGTSSWLVEYTTLSLPN